MTDLIRQIPYAPFGALYGSGLGPYCTGFTLFEFSQARKWLEGLKEIVTRRGSRRSHVFPP